MSLILGVAGSNLKNRFSKLKKNEKSLNYHLNILEKGKPNLKIGILQNNLEQNLKAQNKTLQDFKRYLTSYF